MKERKLQPRLSRGTAREVYLRAVASGEDITYVGICKRLIRGNHLPTLQLAAEVEGEKSKEAKEVKKMIAKIGRIIENSNEYGNDK